MRPVICLVTDRRRYGDGWEEDVVARAGAAARAGVHLVQIRERDLEARALLRLVERCLDIVRGTPARVLVNDRLDVALAAGAHGVHLPATGAPPDRVRRVSPTGFIIGRSVHSSAEAVHVARTGAVDYLTFGTVFPSASKPDATPAGVKELAEAVAAVAVPILAIGGVTVERLSDVAATGASGFAAIGLFAHASADILQKSVRRAEVAFDTLQRKA